MIYVQDNDPVLFSYQNELVSAITSVELLDNSNVVLTVLTDILDSVFEDGTKEWFAIFDPHYFKAGETYKINWKGKDVNGASYTFQETGITVSVSKDFYQTFVATLRRSIFDDGEATDYPIETMLSAVKYASSQMNTQPPFTNYGPEQQPFNLLMDFTKIQLYRGKAAREALETFTYNDIGKSFNLDRSPKLLALVQDLARSAEQQLLIYKKNLRPVMMGLASRYARRSGSTARALFISRAIFRNFVR